ncbi:MAG TPA: hypothetical protein PLJ27_24125, partial [Polyangiaceae bacterium]|nr:hypothetical protein [Polyangiaceae bacterium]HQK20570.1 hypothetical protein [Polyangiaceae bacterium]
MIFEDQNELKARIEQVTPRRAAKTVVVHTDTTAYMGIEGGHVLRLQGNDYFVLGDAQEGRFGIDDQPKFWVKYAVDLTTAEHKIIKLVFHEQFSTNVGMVRVRCIRSPQKESRVLDLVSGHDRFMQGKTVVDPAGNPVRIVDFIRGKSLYAVLEASDMPHERYWNEVLPGIMQQLLTCMEAMAWLHSMGEHHGDIRNDHILIERETGRFTWIDFDYEVNFSDYDVWSMGNVLTYVVGQGMHTFSQVQKSPASYPYAQPL